MNLITSMICLIVWFGHTDSRPVYVRSAEVGDTVTLSCPERSKNPISWYGPPKYMPYKLDGKINPKLIDENIVVVGNHSNGEHTLEIIKVSYSNQGYYRCRLLNKRPVEYEIFLTVEDKPAVVKEITEKHTSYDDHKKTTTPNNLGDSSRHNDKTTVVTEIMETHSSHDYNEETTNPNTLDVSSRHIDKTTVVTDITETHPSQHNHDETTNPNTIDVSSRHIDKTTVVTEIADTHPSHDKHEETTNINTLDVSSRHIGYTKNKTTVVTDITETHPSPDNPEETTNPNTLDVSSRQIVQLYMKKKKTSVFLIRQR